MARELPIACSLDAGERAQRAAEWERLCRRSLLDRRRTDEGLRLRFSADAGTARELERLVALERDCCGFARWTLSSHDDLLELEVAAAAEAVPALNALFDTA